MAMDSIGQYDAEAADRTGRGDFLAFLQMQEEICTVRMSDKNTSTHLMHNL